MNANEGYPWMLMRNEEMLSGNADPDASYPDPDAT